MMKFIWDAGMVRKGNCVRVIIASERLEGGWILVHNFGQCSHGGAWCHLIQVFPPMLSGVCVFNRPRVTVVYYSSGPQS